MANCATEPADAEAEPDALDALESLDVATLAELPDAEPDEDDACDEPQAQSPSVNVVANATTTNTLLPMIRFLSPGVLQTLLPLLRQSRLRHRERSEQLVVVEGLDAIASRRSVRIGDELEVKTLAANAAVPKMWATLLGDPGAR